MKTTTDRKEIQGKLKFIISKYVSLLIKNDSKKIKKSIKKASKAIAKAIAKKIDESDGQITLQKSTDTKKAGLFKPEASVKKKAKTLVAKKATAKPIQKTKKRKTAIKKQIKSSAAKRVTAKSVKKTKKPAAKTTPKTLKELKTPPVVLEPITNNN